ncbi:MAG TPA: hypothetical protein DHV63_01005 [Pseudomonas sp.]|nr:hypothetical protein [Pseudomonas sp.]
MSQKKAKDILDEMTRDELLAWMRSSWHQRPKRSELLYLRWKIQSEALASDYQKEISSLDHLDFSVRDRYAAQCNATNNVAEKLRLLKLIEPYDSAMSAHLKRYKALDARQAKVDRLYEQIDVERNKEAV